MALNRVTDEQARATISQVQALAIKELAAREPGLPSMTAEVRAHLVCLATDAPWCGNDLNEVLDALAPVADKLPKPRKDAGARRPLQNWAPAILGYIPGHIWDQLTACTTTQEAIVVMNTFVAHIGARTLSERTLKCMASLCMLVGDPKAKMRVRRIED